MVPEELAAEVMIARRSCEILEQTRRFFTRHQVRPRFSLPSESDERCLQMVAAGLTGYDLRSCFGLRLGAVDTRIAEQLNNAFGAFVSAL